MDDNLVYRVVKNKQALSITASRDEWTALLLLAMGEERDEHTTKKALAMIELLSTKLGEPQDQTGGEG